MPSRIFPTRALALAVLLLAFVSTNPQPVDAADTSGFAIAAGSIEKIASDKQLDANQLFAKMWQIKGNGSKNISFVDVIRLNIPGRVFITYAASSASDAIGEVKVSGNSEAVVEVVEVVSNTTAGGPKLVLQTTGTATEAAFLLTEIQLFTKNKLKDVLTKGSADVVVLDNVLYTKGETIEAKSKSVFRRLGDKPGVVVEEIPKTVDTETGNPARYFFIKPASGSLSDIQNIALSLGVEGAATLSQMDPDVGDGAYVGLIMVYESLTNSNVSTIDQIKLTATHASDGESLQLQTTATNSKNGSLYSFFVRIVPSVKLETTNTTSVEMHNFLDIPYNDRLLLTSNGTGNVFVSDKNLTVYANYISLTSTGSGNIQVDVGDVVLDRGLSTLSYGSGDITYLGKNLTPWVNADAYGEGRICLESKNDPTVLIGTEDTANQISYTRKKKNAFPCMPMDLPRRVPGKIRAGEKATAIAPVSGADKDSSSSTTSGASGAFQSLLTASVVTLVYTAVMIFVA